MHYVKYDASMTRTPPSSFAACTERYLKYLQSEENKSPLTVQNYRQSLTLLQELLPMLKSIKSFSKESIRDLKQALHEHRTKLGGELRVATKNHHLTVL